MITGRTPEDDVKAQKAAARALEMAFLKKKERQNEEIKTSKPEPVPEPEPEPTADISESDPAPVPAKRQSVRKGGEESGR